MPKPSRSRPSKKPPDEIVSNEVAPGWWERRGEAWYFVHDTTGRVYRVKGRGEYPRGVFPAPSPPRSIPVHTIPQLYELRRTLGLAWVNSRVKEAHPSLGPYVLEKAVGIAQETERLVNRFVAEGTSRKERRRILVKLQAAHSALMPPGPRPLDSSGLASLVRNTLRPLYAEFQRLRKTHEGNIPDTIGEVEKAYRSTAPGATEDEQDAHGRVNEVAPLLLSWRLSEDALALLRKMRRLTEIGFITRVLAGDFGGKPESYSDRIRSLLKASS